MGKRTYEVECSLHVKHSYQKKFIKEVCSIPYFTVEAQSDGKKVHVYGIFEEGKKVEAAHKFFQVCQYYNCSLELPLKFRKNYAFKTYKPNTKVIKQQKAAKKVKKLGKKAKKAAILVEKPAKVGFFRHILNYFK